MTQIFRAVLSMSLSGATLALFILLIRSVFQGRVRPIAYMLLWALVALRLALPFTVESRASVFNYAPEPVQSIVAGQEAAARAQTNPPSSTSTDSVFAPETRQALPDASNPAGNAAQPNSTPAKAAALDWWRLCALVWLGGVLMICLYMLAVNLLYLLILRKNRAYTSPKFKLAMNAAKRNAGLRREVKACAMGSSFSPAVFGLFQPRLMIPCKTFERLSIANQETILTHELLHIKYGDTFLVLVLNLLCALHWFNPVVWVAARAARMDMEHLCDARTVAAMGGRGADYAGALIDAAAERGARKAPSLMIAAIDRKSSVKRRIRMIMQREKVRSSLTIFACALALAAALAGCTAAVAGENAPLADAMLTLPAQTPAPTPEPAPALTGYQYMQMDALPLDAGFTGSLLEIPKDASVYASQAYQSYPDLENWTYAIFQAAPAESGPGIEEIAKKLWAQSNWEPNAKNSDTLNDGDAIFRLYSDNREAVKELGHNEMLYGNNDSFLYRWGVDFTKQDPIVYTPFEGDESEAAREAKAFVQEIMGDLACLGEAPEISARSGGIITVEWELVTSVHHPLDVKDSQLIQTWVSGEGVVYLSYLNKQREVTSEACHGSVISLEQALYCLNYARSSLGAASGGGAKIASATLSVTDAQLLYVPSSDIPPQSGECFLPVFCFTLWDAADEQYYSVLVNCQNGMLFGGLDALLGGYEAGTPYPQLAPTPEPTPPPIPAPDGGQALSHEEAQRLTAAFADHMWNSFYTLEPATLPDFAIDSLSVHLYMRWVDYRLAELEHPYNAGEKLAVPPSSTAALTLSESSAQEGWAVYDMDLLIGQTRVESYVNGLESIGSVRFQYEGGQWKISEFDIEVGMYNEYFRFKQSLAAMRSPRNADIDAMVDGAIEYFGKNS